MQTPMVVARLASMLILGATVAHGASAPQLSARGTRDGHALVIAADGRVRQDVALGAGVVRETFLLDGGQTLVASFADHAVVWSLAANSTIASLPEEVYAVSPDESQLVTFAAGGGVSVWSTAPVKRLARLDAPRSGGPRDLAFSRDGRFLAVEYSTSYPLTDAEYPHRGGQDLGKPSVRLYDLARMTEVEAFRTRTPWVLGEFSRDGTRYFDRSQRVTVRGKPFDAGYAFDLTASAWSRVPGAAPAAAAVGFDVYADILGVHTKLGTMNITRYEPLTWDVSDGTRSAGCVIEGDFAPEAGAPTACLEFWQFVDHFTFPAAPTAACAPNGGLQAPWVDKPRGGYGTLGADDFPRFNDFNRGDTQFHFYDAPRQPLTAHDAGRLDVETTLGIESADVQGRWTYTIPGPGAALHWGFTLQDSALALAPLTVGADTTLDRGKALTQACFAAGTVQIATPVNPCMTIAAPSTQSPKSVGTIDMPHPFLSRVLVGPSYRTAIVPGLHAGDFTATVGGKPASVLAVKQHDTFYTLIITPPGKGDGITADGVYDLRISARAAQGSTLADAESAAVRYGADTQIDVMTVLDRSGSMSWDDKMQSARRAATVFTSYFVPGDAIGVASFATTSRLDFPLSVVDSMGNTIQQARDAISRIAANGSTALGAGLEIGQAQLTARGRSGAASAIVLLTDGMENEPPFVATVLPTIPAKTNVYTIGLGSDADEAILQEIANATGGLYYASPSARDLEAIYDAIHDQVTGRQSLASLSRAVTPGHPDSVQVVVDNSVTAVTFAVTAAGDRLDLSLTRPDGTVIDSTSAVSDSSVALRRLGRAVVLTVRTPQVGTWGMTVSALGTGTDPVPYNGNVSALADLQMHASFYAQSPMVGQYLVPLVALVNRNGPVRHAVITARVTHGAASMTAADEAAGATRRTLMPSASLPPTDTTIVLADDGRHDDGAANDGVYGGYCLPSPAFGSYAVRIAASAAPGTAPFSRTALQSRYMAPRDGVNTLRNVVAYAGERRGLLCVRAWRNNPTRQGPPDVVALGDSAQVLVSMGDLLDGAYSLDAFLDFDRNGIPGSIEPYARLDSTAFLGAAARIDTLRLELRDPPLAVSATPNPHVLTRGVVLFSGVPLDARVTVYDVRGRQIGASPVNAGSAAGEWRWDRASSGAGALRRGVYFFAIDSPSRGRQTGKFVLAGVAP